MIKKQAPKRNASDEVDAVVEYLGHLGFRHVDRNVRVTLGTRRLEADAVAYLHAGFREPHIVVEIKHKLLSEPTILDLAVQQAFAVATALGDDVRYLLITDSREHYWFERDAESQSLEPISNAPTHVSGAKESETTLRPITGSDQYLLLMQGVVDVLRNEGLGFGLRMGIEINKILIAKLQDERAIARGEVSKLSENIPERLAESVRILYSQAIVELGGIPRNEGLWSLSPNALASVLDILRPYSLSSVSRTFRDRTFWKIFSTLLGRAEWHHITPLPLVEFLIKLANPVKGDLVIDPVCGTGLMLLEALTHVESQAEEGSSLRDNSDSHDQAPILNLIGIEVNSEVAELASTNFALNQLPPNRIHNANSLLPDALEAEGIKLSTFDVVVMNPPIGTISKDDAKASGLALPRTGSRVSLESLCIERGIELLRQGGTLAVFVPDAFLSSPSNEHVRAWMLRHTTLRALVSLPSESFMPVGHAGKATILLLEKEQPTADGELLLLDVQSVGYDRFGEPTRDNQLPDAVRLMKRFQEGQSLGVQDVFAHTTSKRLRAWKLKLSDLDPSGFSLSRLDPRAHELVNALIRGPYPSVRLEEVAEVISGRNFKSYVDQGSDAALLIQAGSVKESELQLTDCPYVSMEDYWTAKRSQVKTGDVLVTTTGAYLGRAAAVEKLPRLSVASGAVSILRPGPEIDPSFLEAVINSEIGKEQVARLQASASAQPYIRRKDLGQLIIPLPSLSHQRAIASRISEMLTRARDFSDKAMELEEEAKRIIVSELLESNDDD